MSYQITSTDNTAPLYLCIKHCKIARANAMPAPYIVGLPSMYALVCMAQKLVNTILSDSGLVFESVAICIDIFALSGAQQKHFFYNSKTRKSGKTMRIVGARDSWFEATFLIQVRNLNHQPWHQLQQWLDAHRYLDGLYQLRFAGGSITYASGDPDLCLCEASELPQLLHSIRGVFITDKIDLCRSERQSREDALSCMLRLIEEAKEQHKRFVPLIVGLMPLSKTAHREHTRASLPHQFAEPVIGLGGFVNPEQLPYNLELFECIIWKHSQRRFIVTATLE